MNKDKSIKQIKQLNKAWRMIREAITIIKEVFNSNNDVDCFLWRLTKSNDNLQSFIFKRIQQEYIDEECNKMFKTIEEEPDSKL